jgi:hypothetical protein
MKGEVAKKKIKSKNGRFQSSKGGRKNTVAGRAAGGPAHKPVESPRRL